MEGACGVRGHGERPTDPRGALRLRLAEALGGLLYLAVRRWLADAGRWRGLVFGLLLLATFGSAIIEGGNPDFDRFGYRTLNIAMLASLFIIFGLWRRCSSGSSGGCHDPR